MKLSKRSAVIAHGVLVDKVSIDKGKEELRFIEITPTAKTIDRGKERIFATKSLKLAYVGNVYTIDATATACWPDTLRYFGKWYDTQQMTEWQAKAQAF